MTCKRVREPRQLLVQPRGWCMSEREDPNRQCLLPSDVGGECNLENFIVANAPSTQSSGSRFAFVNDEDEAELQDLGGTDNGQGAAENAGNDQGDDAGLGDISDGWSSGGSEPEPSSSDGDSPSSSGSSDSDSVAVNCDR